MCKNPFINMWWPIICHLLSIGNWGRQEKGRAGGHRCDNTEEAPSPRDRDRSEEDRERKHNRHCWSLQTNLGNIQLQRLSDCLSVSLYLYTHLKITNLSKLETFLAIVGLKYLLNMFLTYKVTNEGFLMLDFTTTILDCWSNKWFRWQ